MKQRISLEHLSKYRTQFMGIAIILVMLCHNTISVPQDFSRIHNMLKSICQCGVDIFMLLSGLGCYYSFNKTPKVLAFWKKRFTRIIIPYIIAVAVYAFVYVGYLGRTSFSYYIWSYSLVSFFTDGAMIAWFVAAIITLYLLFPIIYRILQHSTQVFAVVFGTIFVGCILISYLPVPQTLNIVNELFFCRIAAFLAGAAVGKALKSEKKIAIQSWVLFLTFILTTLLILLVLWLSPGNYWTFTRLLFLPFTFAGMLLLGELMTKINNVGFFDKALLFLGGITFELFLIHDKMLATINEFLYLFTWNKTVLTLCANVLAIVSSIICAWILYKVVSFILPNSKKR